jgi:hypothetical protein
MKTFAFILAFCLIFGGVAVAAEKLKEPTVEYSALMTMQAEGAGTMLRSRVYHAMGGKERHEPLVEKGAPQQAMIMRLDRKVAWVLMPEQKMYMEMAIKDARKGGGDVSDCTFDMKEGGAETVNGVMATRSEVKMSCPEEGKGEGTLWTTKEGVMVKMDATMTDKDGRKTHVRIDLTDLKVGKQDPALFELPRGYTKMDMGKVFQGGGTPGAGTKPAEAEKEEEAAPESEEPSMQEEPAEGEPAQESTTDKLKKLKGILKW